MCLNHPETIPLLPSPSMEKLSSMKLVPSAKNVGDCYYAPSPLRDLLSNTQALKHIQGAQ